MEPSEKIPEQLNALAQPIERQPLADARRAKLTRANILRMNRIEVLREFISARTRSFLNRAWWPFVRLAQGTLGPSGG